MNAKIIKDSLKKFMLENQKLKLMQLKKSNSSKKTLMKNNADLAFDSLY